MLAVRQRAACLARRAWPTAKTPSRQATRSYASDHGHHDDHHHHDHAPQVEESPGMALYLSLGAIGLSMVTYTVSRPGEDGEPGSLSKWIDSFRAESLPTWEQRNNMRTDMMEQAAADRHMFLSVEKAKGFELRTPELINSGCPNNVPAGHYPNMDKVMEHYRKQHLDDEERKAKKLAQSKNA